MDETFFREGGIHQVVVDPELLVDLFERLELIQKSQSSTFKNARSEIEFSF